VDHLIVGRLEKWETKTPSFEGVLVLILTRIYEIPQVKVERYVPEAVDPGTST
jgi:hypothetical protein